MPDTDPLSPDAIDEMWARFEREVGPAASALSPADRAMLAVLYVARDRSVTVKQARELVVRASVVGGPTSIPSESTSSRHRERLEAILHAAAPPLDAGADADAATILRAAIGGQSYARLRRDYRLLWDPGHLRQACLRSPRRSVLRRTGDRARAGGRGGEVERARADEARRGATR